MPERNAAASVRPSSEASAVRHMTHCASTGAGHSSAAAAQQARAIAASRSAAPGSLVPARIGYPPIPAIRIASGRISPNRMTAFSRSCCAAQTALAIVALLVINTKVISVMNGRLKTAS